MRFNALISVAAVTALVAASTASTGSSLNEAVQKDQGCLSSVTCGSEAAEEAEAPGAGVFPYVSNEILVRFSPKLLSSASRVDGVDVNMLQASLFEAGSIETIDISAVYPSTHALAGVYRCTVAEGTDILASCAELSKSGTVLYAEPNYYAELHMTPNDPYYSSVGAWGQEYADMWAAQAINAEGAWDTTQGAGVVIAIVDTGVDYEHPDLAGNIWVNAGEIADNGVDDDDNGYIDDVYGYDIGELDSDPADTYGHGTFQAGVAAAVGNNNAGIIGVAPQAKVMAVKAFDDTTSATADQLAEGIIYAADNGANIINTAWGIGRNQTTLDAIEYAQGLGSLIVASAGNNSTKALLYFPASAPDVLTTASVGLDFAKTADSNYGTVVDVCAPGIDVLSLRAAGTDMYGDADHFVPPGDSNANYYRMDGTSAACPFATGVAALVKAADPTLTAVQIRRIIAASTAAVESPDYYIGTGMLDASAAAALVGTVSGVGAGVTDPANDWEAVATSAPIDVYGTAAGDSYVLEYGVGFYPTEWTTIGTGATVNDGLLGTAPTGVLGPFHVRLTVTDGAMTAVEHATFVGDPDRHEGWPVYLGGSLIDLGGFLLGSCYTSTLADANNDGVDEIYIGSAGLTFALDGDGDFFPGWPTEQNETLAYGTNDTMPGPSIADFDGDGEGEVLWTMRDYSYGSTYYYAYNAVNFDGTDVSGFPQETPSTLGSAGAFNEPFVMGDLDNDGDLEAFSAHCIQNGGNFNHISAFDHMGALLFTYIFEGANERSQGIVFGDLDGNGAEEIACISTKNVQNCNVLLNVFDADGTMADGYPIVIYHLSGTETVVGSPILYDMDDDGELEIVIGVSGSQAKVHAYHRDGTAVSGWPIQVGDSCQMFEFSLGDITGDGAPEVLASVNYRLTTGLNQYHALDIASGTELPGWPYDVWATNRCVPTIVDVDNNGVQDACFIAEDGKLYAISGDGSDVYGYPKHMNYVCRSGVSVGDVDGDGLFELVATTVFGSAYVWDTPTPALPTRADWPMRHANARNTGLFEPGRCSDAGGAALNQSSYACNSSVSIEVVDCGLNQDDGSVETVTIDIDSDTETGVEQVVLTETAVDSAVFIGSIAVSTTNDAGVLWVAEGDVITATYSDADNGFGVPAIATATAIVDCTAPEIGDVEIVDVYARGATVLFSANEPVRGIIQYGLSCGNLNQTAEASFYATSPLVNLVDLVSGQTYYCVVIGEDKAGNSTYDDNGGSCYTFETPVVPDYFTEYFQGDFDLSYSSIKFTPNGSDDYYEGCLQSISEFPTDPTDGTEVVLSDDGSQEFSLTDGVAVSVYGVDYGSFWICANGSITFGAGDTEWAESLEAHFSFVRVGGLFRDFSPQNGGTLSYKQTADRLAVTYENCPEYPDVGLNNFQIEMFFDGTITISYLSMDAATGIAGLSEGLGLQGDFYETYLSEMGACCFGDIWPPEGDGAVDLQDLSALLGNYGMTSGATYLDGDFDGDGDVDLSDLAHLLALYGTSCN